MYSLQIEAFLNWDVYFLYYIDPKFNIFNLNSRK